jgi:trigger factor
VHVPDTMWEGVANQRLRDIQEEQQKEGKSLEQYAQENGMTVEQMVEALQHEAQTHVKRAVLVQEIAIKEEMKLTNQDLNDELILMSREYGMKPEEMLGVLKKNEAMGELQHRAIFRKVTQFLNEHANAQEVAMA